MSVTEINPGSCCDYFITKPAVGKQRCKCMHSNANGFMRLCASTSISHSKRIMRLTAFMLLIACLEVSANSYGQLITLQENNIRLEKVLSKIKQQSGYHFVYREDWMRQSKNVTVHLVNVELHVALNACFKGQPLTYSIVGNTIVIRQKEEVNGDEKNPEIAITPSLIVKGNVISNTGEPVVGASVIIKGSPTIGTVTDVKGDFELGNIADDAILIISGSNIETMEVKVGGNLNLIITATYKVGTMNEVLVVAYGTQKRTSFTGSASVLKGATINGAPRTNALESLQGNVSGVIVSTGSGQPGAEPSVRIRGIGSVNAVSSPLYVIDGVPLESSSFNSINPADIESMTVLKDASAASLYGSRAANGVIIITTKKGASGKTIFEFSSQYGINKATLSKNDFPLTTRESLELIRESWINSGRDATLFPAAIVSNGVDSTIDTDWYRELTRNGPFQQHNLSISGGNEKTRFFISGSYYMAKAALKGSDFKRGTASFRISNQATDKLSFNLNIKLNVRTNNEQPEDGSNGNPVRMYKRYQSWLKVYNADGTYDLSYANNYNPIAVVKENWNRESNYGIIGGLLTKYQVFKNLSLENQANIDFNYGDSREFYKAGIGTARTNGGEALFASGRASNFVNTTIIRYNKEFNSHNFGVFAGYESQQTFSQGNYVEKENFLPNTYTLDNASLLVDGGSNETERTLNSTFLSASYDFNKKYYVTASYRRDGSSRFGANNRFGNFWSLGLSWNIVQEKFVTDQKLFSELRLRTSYGVNGNESIGNFASRGLYTSGGADYMGSPGLILSSFGNSQLSWEKNKPFNVGLDFGVLKNRLRGTLEYFTRTTSNLLMERTISATNGLTSYMDNVGSIKNSGLELELSSINIKPKKKEGFEWTTSFNISTIKNRVTAIESPITSSRRVVDVNRDFYQYNMIAYAGVDPLNGESLWYTDASKTTTTNNYANAGRADFGSALPKFYGGLTNIFSYKGISLNCMFSYNFGNEIYDNWGPNANSDGSRNFSATDKMPRYTYNNRWQKPGDITDVPKMLWSGTQSGSSSHSSSRFLYKGDYVRLRDVSIGYSLPTSVTQSLKMGSVRFYARANNLATWVKDKRINFDPEVGIEGDADQNAPIYKTVIFGLDIRF
jgi:TonB-linked SusC/RagA family outer membrane protein